MNNVVPSIIIFTVFMKQGYIKWNLNKVDPICLQVYNLFHSNHVELLILFYSLGVYMAKRCISLFCHLFQLCWFKNTCRRKLKRIILYQGSSLIRNYATPRVIMISELCFKELLFLVVEKMFCADHCCGCVDGLFKLMSGTEVAFKWPPLHCIRFHITCVAVNRVNSN